MYKRQDQTYDGERSLRYAGVRSDYTFCQWTWDGTDWEHDPESAGPNPIRTLCTDGNGNDCAFAFAVTFRRGREVDGDCRLFGLGNLGAGEVLQTGVGFHEDYQVGLTSYGPMAMYFALGSWYPHLGGRASFVEPTFYGSQIVETGPAPY